MYKIKCSPLFPFVTGQSSTISRFFPTAPIDRKSHQYNPFNITSKEERKNPPSLEANKNPYAIKRRKLTALNALYTYGILQHLKTFSKKELMQLYNNPLTEIQKNTFMNEVFKHIKINLIPNPKITVEVEREYRTDVYYALKAGLYLMKKGVISTDGAIKEQDVYNTFYAILRICDNRNKARTSKYNVIADKVDARLVGKGLSRDLHDPQMCEKLYDQFNSVPGRIAKWEATGFPYNKYDLSREYYHQKANAAESARKSNSAINKRYDVPWHAALELRMEILRKGYHDRPLKDYPYAYSELDAALESVLREWYEKGAYSDKPFNVFADITTSKFDEALETSTPSSEFNRLK